MTTPLSTSFPQTKKIESYQVIYEPKPTPGLATLSQTERCEYDRLYQEALKAPKATLPSIQAFREKHPTLPEIENLLAVVYLYLRDIRQVETLIQESYQKFPDYLFARINYADQCLRKKKVEEVAKIFNHTLELSSLYPEKTLFHVSEFRGFNVLMSLYHIALKDTEKATSYYLLAKEADPEHPSVTSLEKKLFRPPLLKRIAHFLRIR